MLGICITFIAICYSTWTIHIQELWITIWTARIHTGNAPFPPIVWWVRARWIFMSERVVLTVIVPAAFLKTVSKRCGNPKTAASHILSANSFTNDQRIVSPMQSKASRNLPSWIAKTLSCGNVFHFPPFGSASITMLLKKPSKSLAAWVIGVIYTTFPKTWLICIPLGLGEGPFRNILLWRKRSLVGDV